MRLAQRAVSLTEFMDDPGCDPTKLRRTVERFSIVNRLVSCWGAVYRQRVTPVFAELSQGRRAWGGPATPLRILDIGCGGGDVLRRLVRRSRRDGFDVSATGIDPDARLLHVAQSTPMSGVTFHERTSRDLAMRGERYDLVISNHLMHHLDDVGLAGLFADSEVLAGSLSLHSDIARGRGAYVGYAVGAAPIAAGSYLRVDGLRSIRRSYTASELGAVLPLGWAVERPGPFRLLASRLASPARPSAR